MGVTKQQLEEMQELISVEITDYLEACDYDISSIYDQEKVDELAWELANDKYVSAMEDRADAQRDLDRECHT